MFVNIMRDVMVRKRRSDGTDGGTLALKAGRYEANQTQDGALEILLSKEEPVYMLPFIWWEKMELGEVILN